MMTGTAGLVMWPITGLMMLGMITGGAIWLHRRTAIPEVARRAGGE